MLIKIEKLKTELDKYNETVSKYEELKIGLYNELKNLTNFWQDERTEEFFDKVNSQKIECEEIISDMNNISEVYTYIIQSYEDLGNEIEFDLSQRDELMSKFKKCINVFDDIIEIYESMNLSLIDEKEIFLKQKEKVIKTKKRLVEYKINIDTILSEINEIEAQVKSKIRNINIKVINSEAGEL